MKRKGGDSWASVEREPFLTSGPVLFLKTNLGKLWLFVTKQTCAKSLFVKLKLFGMNLKLVQGPPWMPRLNEHIVE